MLNGYFSRRPAEGMVELDGDTAMNKYTLNAALHAAGAAVQAVDLVMEVKLKMRFAASGHLDIMQAAPVRQVLHF